MEIQEFSGNSRDILPFHFSYLCQFGRCICFWTNPPSRWATWLSKGSRQMSNGHVFFHGPRRLTDETQRVSNQLCSHSRSIYPSQPLDIQPSRHLEKLDGTRLLKHPQAIKVCCDHGLVFVKYPTCLMPLSHRKNHLVLSPAY